MWVVVAIFPVLSILALGGNNLDPPWLVVPFLLVYAVGAVAAHAFVVTKAETRNSHWKDPYAQMLFTAWWFITVPGYIIFECFYWVHQTCKQLFKRIV